MTVEQLFDDLEAAGVCTLDTGGHLSAAEARRLACRAGIVPMVLGGKGQVLDVGRKRRLHTEAMRIAMGVRDGGCTAEHCETPPGMCHAHHDIPLVRGRPDQRRDRPAALSRTTTAASTTPATPSPGCRTARSASTDESEEPEGISLSAEVAGYRGGVTHQPTAAERWSSGGQLNSVRDRTLPSGSANQAIRSPFGVVQMP